MDSDEVEPAPDSDDGRGCGMIRRPIAPALAADGSGRASESSRRSRPPAPGPGAWSSASPRALGPGAAAGRGVHRGRRWTTSDWSRSRHGHGTMITVTHSTGDRGAVSDCHDDSPWLTQAAAADSDWHWQSTYFARYFFK